MSSKGYSFPNAVQSKNSEFSRGISRILPVLGKIIMYLRNLRVHLKIISCREVHVSAINREKSQILAIIGEITEYLCKTRNEKSCI